MIVTDGSPETYEEIFEEYNAPNYEVMNAVEQPVSYLTFFHVRPLTFSVFL